MKYLLFKVMLACVAATTYVSSPFVTAWQIREAVRNGDSAYLENALEWDSVRASLKPGLSSIALNLPPETSAAPAGKPSLWQRIKAYWGRGAVESAVDSYLTPEGLPKLFALRRSYRTLTGAEDESKAPVLERIKRTWARVKRAEFTSLTTFELDMIDKYDATRMILGKMRLTSIGWKLQEVRIKILQAADDGATPQRFAPQRFAMTETGTVTDAETDAAETGMTPTPQPKKRFGARLFDALSFIGRARAAARVHN